MAADFPTSVKTFTTKTNNVYTIDASHVNDLQDEVNAVETLLGAASSRRTTWTPVVSFTTSNTGMTYTSSGFSARFGSMIFLYGEFTITAKGSASGELRITNAPLVSFTGAPCSFACSFITNTWTTLQPHVARVGSGTQIIDFYHLSGATWTRISDTHVQTNSALRFSGFYFHA